jgi:hypothetical protein
VTAMRASSDAAKPRTTRAFASATRAFTGLLIHALLLVPAAPPLPLAAALPLRR